MLITKRSDYAMRIMRVLSDNKVHNVKAICEREGIPKAFAYKILRELEQAGLVKSERGNQGGYYLNKSLEELTIYDVVKTMEEDVDILHCMHEECERNTSDIPCRVHREMLRIQMILNQELKSRTIAEILSDE